MESELRPIDFPVAPAVNPRLLRVDDYLLHTTTTTGYAKPPTPTTSDDPQLPMYARPTMPAPHFQQYPRQLQDVLSRYETERHGAHTCDPMAPVPRPEDVDKSLARYAYLLALYERKQNGTLPPTHPLADDTGEHTLHESLLGLILDTYMSLESDANCLHVVQKCLVAAKKRQVHELELQLAAERYHLDMIERNEVGFGALRDHIGTCLGRGANFMQHARQAIRHGAGLTTPQHSTHNVAAFSSPVHKLDHEATAYAEHYLSKHRGIAAVSPEPESDEEDSHTGGKHLPPRGYGGKGLPQESDGYGGKRLPPGYGGKRPRSDVNSASEMASEDESAKESADAHVPSPSRKRRRVQAQTPAPVPRAVQFRGLSGQKQDERDDEDSSSCSSSDSGELSQMITAQRVKSFNQSACGVTTSRSRRPPSYVNSQPEFVEVSLRSPVII